MCSSWGHSLKPFLGALSTQQSLNGVGEGETGDVVVWAPLSACSLSRCIKCFFKGSQAGLQFNLR